LDKPKGDRLTVEFVVTFEFSTRPMHTPSTDTAPATADQHDVALATFATSNELPLYLDTVPVIAAELLQAQRIHALIGPDILKRCVLHTTGPPNCPRSLSNLQRANFRYGHQGSAERTPASRLVRGLPSPTSA
jgi:hypothetical protein